MTYRRGTKIKRKGCGACGKKTTTSKTTTKQEEQVVIEKNRVYKTRMSYNRDGINFNKVMLSNKYGTTSVAKYMAELESWKKTPFRHRDKKKGRDGGVDCIHLVIGVYQNLDLLPKDITIPEYDKGWYLRSDSPDQHPAFDVLKDIVDLDIIKNKMRVKAGDVAVFEFGRANEAHVGLITSRKTVIHSVNVNGAGVIESRLDETIWGEKFRYAYRFRESSL